MVEIFRTRELASARLASIREKHPEFDEVTTRLQSANFATMNGDVLSEFVLELSTLMIRISEIVADYVSDYNEAYQFRGYYQSMQYHKHRDQFSQGDAEQYAKKDCFSQKQEELVASLVADRLKANERAYTNIISVIQSRLKVLANERNAY